MAKVQENRSAAESELFGSALRDSASTETANATGGNYCQLLQGHWGSWKLLACEWKNSESACQSWAQSAGADTYVF
jgi:hypothetical protein